MMDAVGWYLLGFMTPIVLVALVIAMAMAYGLFEGED